MAAQPGTQDIKQYVNAIASASNMSLVAKFADLVKNDAKISPYDQLGCLIQICDEASRIPADVKPKLIDVFMQYDPRGCVRYINKKTEMLTCINREQANLIAEQHKEIVLLKLAGSKKRKADEEGLANKQDIKRLVGYDKAVGSKMPSNGSA